MNPRGSQPSPCVRKCCLDGEVCLGCGRLLSEIIEWAGACDRRQRDIIEAAAKRQALRRRS
ncbi:DUF1289 domain-containing protein [Pseudomonas sp.]|uniref:DUF1289 domain-containing protein n=1 Tax=Pseudomonas sp. TaxID=306 RepID=UPI003242E058